MNKIFLIFILLFAFSCDQSDVKEERFIGIWVPTKKGNELIPEELIKGTELTISKEAHLYFANYTIERDGRKIDMYKSLLKESGTPIELTKQMFTYELSANGVSLTNVLNPKDMIVFDTNNDLIKFPMLFGEFYVWMEKKN